MNAKSFTSQYLIIILLLLPFIYTTRAQDSLYLVGTITGESNEKRINVVRAIGDINGDGYDDFIISFRNGNVPSDQGIIKLYLGTPNFDLTPDIIFHYPGNEYLNDFSDGYGIGDVNSDGYNDFVLCGAFASPLPKGKVFLYYGGETIDTIPVAEFYQPNSPRDNFGYPVQNLGDINKDGYDDFAICSAYNWSDGKGYVYLFWGGDTISWDRSLTFSSDTLGDFFGTSIANIGDINNDSFDDIAIGAPIGSIISDYGRVFFYFGGTHFDNIPDTILISTNPGDEFGRIIKNAGDLNSDGKIDFVLTNLNEISIFLSMDSIIIVDGYELGYGGYVNIEPAGDVNNDGYEDLIIGNTNFRNSDSIMVGGAFIYLGGDIINTNYTFNLEGENQWDEFSKMMTTGDINRDGYYDLIILAPGYPDYQEPTGKVYFYSYRKINSVRQTNDNHLDNFKLYQNFPNPFNPATTINYQLPKAGFVTLKVYDILGREAATLVNEKKSQGRYSVNFNGSALASGVYIYRIRANDYVSSKKMMLIK